MTRSLLMGSTLKVAKNHRRSETLWQPVDLFVEYSPQLIVSWCKALLSRMGCPPLVPLASCGRGPGTSGSAECHLMEPWAERIANPEPAGFLDQYQERRLERVQAVVRIVEHASADAQNHGTMPLDQCRERQFGRFAALSREKLEELAVGQIANRSQMK